jgi:hypothetical protein
MAEQSQATLKSQFESDDNERRPVLDAAVACANLTKPWVLTDSTQKETTDLPQTYQSLGSRGTTHLVGRMLLALYPPGMPWFQFQLAPNIWYDPNVPAEQKQESARYLFLRELVVTALLEGSNLEMNRRRRATFRSRKRMALDQVIITGDCLEQLTDDFRLKVFSRRQYVTRRDSEGDVLYHIIWEVKDPLALTPDQVAGSGLDMAELQAKPVKDRVVHLYTMVEWQPQTRIWLIRQEVNGKIVVESEEKISPFFSTPFELPPNEHYGRGFVELHKGDLNSFSELREKMLDFAATHSKQLFARDYASRVRPKDLEKESGSHIMARVVGGKVDDVGVLAPTNATSFQVVRATTNDIRADLGTAMLMDSETLPEGERVTRAQIERVAAEIDGALGGVYAPIADDQQLPMLQRAIHLAERQNMIPVLPGAAVEVKLLTGLAALNREMLAAKLGQVTQVISTLGEQAAARINVDVFIDALLRYAGIYEPGIIKHPEQMQTELQQQISTQLQQAAGEKAIDTAGNIAEQQAAPPAPAA